LVFCFIAPYHNHSLSACQGFILPLLKRGLGGTYISVEPFHLFRYLDEQSFRFNKRKLTDSERFSLVAEQVIGRRLTYAELTGKASKDA